MGFDQQIQDVEQQNVYTYNYVYIYMYWFSQQKKCFSMFYSQQTLGEPAIKWGLSKQTKLFIWVKLALSLHQRCQIVLILMVFGDVVGGSPKSSIDDFSIYKWLYGYNML